MCRSVHRALERYPLGITGSPTHGSSAYRNTWGHDPGISQRREKRYPDFTNTPGESSSEVRPSLFVGMCWRRRFRFVFGASAGCPSLPTLEGGIHFTILVASDSGTNFIHRVVKTVVFLQKLLLKVFRQISKVRPIPRQGIPLTWWRWVLPRLCGCLSNNRQ